MNTADKIAIESCVWTINRARAINKRVAGRKPTKAEVKEIKHLLGRLKVAKHDLDVEIGQ